MSAACTNPHRAVPPRWLLGRTTSPPRDKSIPSLLGRRLRSGLGRRRTITIRGHATAVTASADLSSKAGLGPALDFLFRVSRSPHRRSASHRGPSDRALSARVRSRHPPRDTMRRQNSRPRRQTRGPPRPRTQLQELLDNPQPAASTAKQLADDGNTSATPAPAASRCASSRMRRPRVHETSMSQQHQSRQAVAARRVPEPAGGHSAAARGRRSRAPALAWR
jgi:hypothetical protein